MRSKDKLEVVIRQMPQFGNKWWALVRFRKTSLEWVPSFEDLFRIVKAIADCEDRKYPRTEGYEGYRKVQKIMCAACEPRTVWERVRDQFEIPNRDEGDS